jgi:integrase
LADWPDILAGRKPQQDPAALTVAELVNTFLTARRDKVNSGELTPRAWAEYHLASDRIVASFGRARAVADWRPADFGKLRATVAKTLGPAALSKFVALTKTIFAFGFEAELMAAPVRYGGAFDKPPKKVMRLVRHQRARRLIPAADLWKLLDAAGVQLRAMLLLGINCGFGQKDCSDLQRSALDVSAKWIDSPRLKTGIARRAPLWPETVEALSEVNRTRPDPRDLADPGCVFITSHGRRRHKPRQNKEGEEIRGLNLDAVAFEFRKVCTLAKVKAPGGPYTLRHTFRTVADEVKDQPAIDLIMGHADHSVSDYYREHVSDERLSAVVNHVRDWLLAGRPQGYLGQVHQKDYYWLARESVVRYDPKKDVLLVSGERYDGEQPLRHAKGESKGR